MQRFLIKLIVATIAFFIGVAATTVWWSADREPPRREPNPPPLASSPCSLSACDQKIVATQAVQLAECFVIGNGYTALAPIGDKSQLSYESWDDGPPAEEALNRRHNTIESKAYGVMKGGRTKDGWTVVFRYNLSSPKFSHFRPDTLEHFRTVGRAVTMDGYGGNMRVEHEDFILKGFRKAEEIY